MRVTVLFAPLLFFLLLVPGCTVGPVEYVPTENQLVGLWQRVVYDTTLVGISRYENEFDFHADDTYLLTMRQWRHDQLQSYYRETGTWDLDDEELQLRPRGCYDNRDHVGCEPYGEIEVLIRGDSLMMHFALDNSTTATDTLGFARVDF